MYDQFAADYDRFVNWKGRLAFEMPLLEQLLTPLKASGRVVRVLDAACGTGMHAIELARRGYDASGADLSGPMIAQAAQNALAAGLEVRFEAAGFGQLASTFGTGSQDALICLGNSLPHALTAEERAAALEDFFAVLKPGGRLIIQNRNFDKVLLAKERWMEPQSHHDGEEEWLFLRFYDYRVDGLIDFNIVTLRRGETGWTQNVRSTRLYPLTSDELLSGLIAAGFGQIQAYGSMDGRDYDPLTSDNLIVSAARM